MTELPPLEAADAPELEPWALARLLELGQRVVTELDVQALLPLVARYAREVVDAELLIVPMVAADAGSYRYVAADGEGAELVIGQSFPADFGACGWVMVHRRPLLFGRGARYELKPDAAWEPGLPSSLVVPLVARGRVTGGLAALGKRGGGAFDRRDLAVLTVFANLSGVAVDNAHLFDALGAAQRQAEASARENATLLREVHHRVKNNLQIVTSLLTLHDPELLSPEGRAMLTDCASRVRSMALVHEQLYGGTALSRIELGRYARDLVAALHRAMAPEARVQVACEAVEVSLDQAIPLGLILNELVTNAFKYGLPPSDPSSAEADVQVTVGRRDGGLFLEVRDRGPGLPAELPARQTPRIGMKLVRSLVRQVRGRLSTSEGPHLRVELTAPLGG